MSSRTRIDDVTPDTDWLFTWDLSEVGLFDQTPILGADITITPSTGLTMGSAEINDEGNQVQVRIKGFTSWKLYILKCLQQTVEGYQRPFEFEA